MTTIADVWQAQDMAQTIFSYLEPKDLARASRVCKAWYQTAQSEGLWQSFCQRLGASQPFQESWKQRFYQLNYTLKGIRRTHFFSLSHILPTTPSPNKILVIKGQPYQCISNCSKIRLIDWKTESSIEFQEVDAELEFVKTNRLHLVAATRSKEIKIFDLKTQQLCRSIDISNQPKLISMICDEEYVIVHKNEGLSIWNITTGDLFKNILVPHSGYMNLLKRIDKNIVLNEYTGSSTESQLALVDMMTGLCTTSTFEDDIRYTLSDFCVHANMKYIAAMSGSHKFRVWDLTQSPHKIISFQTSETYPTQIVESVRCVWKNSLLFITLSYASHVRPIRFPEPMALRYTELMAWDITSQKCVYEVSFKAAIKQLISTDDVLIAILKDKISEDMSKGIIVQFGHTSTNLLAAKPMKEAQSLSTTLTAYLDPVFSVAQSIVQFVKGQF